MKEDMAITREKLHEALEALQKPGSRGEARGSIKTALYHLHTAERKAMSRETELTERLAEIALGWVCDQINHGELKEKEVNRFIRDMTRYDLKDYFLQWKVVGAPAGRCEGDLLVGLGGDGDPVVFDLGNCERIHEDWIVAYVDELLLESLESAPYDTLEEAQV